jgi:hypothetical protein
MREPANWPEAATRQSAIGDNSLHGMQGVRGSSPPYLHVQSLFCVRTFAIQCSRSAALRRLVRQIHQQFVLGPRCFDCRCYFPISRSEGNGRLLSRIETFEIHSRCLTPFVSWFPSAEANDSQCKSASSGAQNRRGVRLQVGHINQTTILYTCSPSCAAEMGT